MNSKTMEKMLILKIIENIATFTFSGIFCRVDDSDCIFFLQLFLIYLIK